MTQEFWNTMSGISGLGTEDDATIALIRHVARHKRETIRPANQFRQKAPVLVPAE